MLPHMPLTWMHQVERHAHTKPSTPAMRFGGLTTSWSELADRTTRLGHALSELGVGSGDRVLVLLKNRPEFIETVIAVNRIGAIAVPVNFRLAADEVEYIIRDSGGNVIVTEGGLIDVTDAACAGIPLPPIKIVCSHPEQMALPLVSYDELLATTPAVEHPWPLRLEDIALIMYTSGTTGNPKGAMLSYENLLAGTIAVSQIYQLTDEDTISLITSPLFHIAGVGAALPSLILGHTSVIVPTGAFDVEAFLDTLEQEAVTTAFLVPTQWQSVCSSTTLSSRDIQLKVACWGAAPATPALLHRMNDCFPGVSIVSGFGQTEMSPNTVVLRGQDAVRKLGSVGKPLPHVMVRVVDAEMNDVPAGQVGEIVYRGPSTMAGYWNKPDATEEAFHGGWFHSGDLVRVDEDGFIYVVDRLKDMIISGGENIYCAEVENVIAGHPQVQDVALVAKKHDHWGETPVAVILAANPEDPPSAADIIEYCQERLASYKKPTAVLIVEELPRNASGKILKSRLRQMINA
ncbi:long-chain-fatty-acid--CoA ligase [Rhodococcus sp. B50]|uniref:long-chain-fatty-acid--CoA ligase n=1 Tax=Rhodococcus sp. B50 TaxID=2682847 RepID=UPI001BD4BD70|nr:long-chain-fatty-acid--CoA ligase [Rhodococcus sp. B50]MBS9376030.1 Long-chain-fatty-acid--CoA ligase [Rhodococcus sp. B50]